MSPDDLERKLRQRPLAPFRLYLTDGATFDVRHPELVMLGRRSLVFGLNRDPEATRYERTVDVDLLHIVRIESVDTRSAGKDNGP